VPIDLPHLIAILSRRRAAGKKFGIVMVAEGARFPESAPFERDGPPGPIGHSRLGGVSGAIADAIEKQTRIETRCVVLGHIQRGGTPSAYDRILATRLGLAASRLVLQQRFGTLVTLRNDRIVETSLSESIAATKRLDLAYYDEAAAFFH
jgi:6-phosphofructokinase 1